MKVPHCLVIIPDGNRRHEAEQDSAKQANGELCDKVEIAKAAHTRGLANCRTIAQAAFDLGVQHVVLWGASESNLKKRDPQEIAFLYHLLKEELKYSAQEKPDYGFRLCGRWNVLRGDQYADK